ncbi:DUF481 domain-containing protein [Aequorivita todarodis]|nr:DUF481 domain-containing protein [Aequorivita todarodis]
MKTSYSDSDFAIDWSQVKRIFSEKEYIISSTDGEIYNGALGSENDNEIVIYSADSIITTIPSENIVYLRTLKATFISRLSASLALGYNFTKSNNLGQINLRSTLGYKARKWTIQGNFNGISATRDDVEDVQRLDAALSYRYFLKKDWYPLVEINWLANTEQNIKLRTVTRVGIGKYIKRTNDMYWGVQVGTSYNNESFTEGAVTSQNSLEGFIGSELNLFDIGDLSLLTRVVAYPGITESGRLRMDGLMDLQYDLPLDFFIKLGFTVNYDNRSTQASNEYDYIFQTSFGWEL